MRAFPGNRRSIRTAVLIAAALGAAIWIDLSVLGSTGINEPDIAAAAPGELVVDVTVPGSPATAPDTSVPGQALPGGQLAQPAASSAVSTQPAPATPGAAVPAPQASFSSPAPAPEVIAPPVTSAPAPTTTTTRPGATTTPTTPPPNTTFHTATFSGVADVVVADTGGQLEFWSCTPASGWGYQVEKNGPTEVEVKFRRTSGEGEAKIEITRRSDGTLSIKREN